VGEYLDRWLSDSVKDTVRTGTLERHEQIIRLHIGPCPRRPEAKGSRPRSCPGLIPRQTRRRALARHGAEDPRDLHKALDQAVRWSLVPRNATEVVKAPRPNPDEIRPLSSEQVKVLLEAADRGTLRRYLRAGYSYRTSAG
jgi:integrase